MDREAWRGAIHGVSKITFMVPESCFLFLIFIYLAASGLSCST